MGRLGDHPNIVTVYDVGDDAGQPFLVSQYMAGGSLEERLRPPVDGSTESTSDARGEAGRNLPTDETLRLADQLCRALEHAHAHGVIHRDLKPANVWLAADGTAKLGDFGLALARERSRLTLEGMVLGTVAYMAPEQVLGKPVDVRSDLYSLGALLYELVAGRPPFVGGSAVAVISQHLHTPPVAPSRHNPVVPAAVEELILQLLEKEPERRLGSATAVREALTRVSAMLQPAVVADARRAGTMDPTTGRAAERRQLTVLFCDVVASTGLAARIDDEDLREVMRRYYDAVAETVARYGGHIANYLGDGLLVYFGYPQAHEDDAERAVRAGLDLVRDVGCNVADVRLDDRPAAEPGLRLALRIGVHTGPVIVGDMAGGPRREALAIGDTVNVAARLQSQAKAGEVVCSAAVLKAAGEGIRTTPLGALELKGRKTPVEAYRVEGMS
jgi:class 3 adenylate cyclase